MLREALREFLFRDPVADLEVATINTCEEMEIWKPDRRFVYKLAPQNISGFKTSNR
jgi:hypothetical protein